MVETLTVSLSGPAFSLLLYENVRSEYNQEGFLLGEIVEKETNSITDNDEQVTKIDRVIKVNSAVPCPQVGYFYDGAGKINKKAIANFLGKELYKVVAWYKFKRSNAFKLTVRDKIVHKQLSSYFAPSPELFTCCLLTSSFKRLSPTHLDSQIFLRYHKMSFQNLPIHINNLSDPSNLYKTPEPCSETFNNLFKSLSIDKNKTQALNVITRLNTALQKYADQLVVDLADTEKQCFDLEQEVRQLREQALAKKIIQDDVTSVENGKIDGDLKLEKPEIEISSEDNQDKSIPKKMRSKDVGRNEKKVDNLGDSQARRETRSTSVSQKS